MTGKTCCFTGHRIIPRKEIPILRKKLLSAVEQLIGEGYKFFGTGGALGFDTLAAEAVLSLKEKYPFIKLILVIPCRNQAEKWNARDVAQYEKIKKQADKISCISEYYTPSCMFERNRKLVDYSDACIAYLRENRGGTFYTVNYAKQKNLRIINLASGE